MKPSSALAVVCALIAPAFFAAAAHSQILPKTPPPPGPRVEYTPPPPPPKPAEVAPPEPEPDVPTLVARDAAGKLLRVAGLPDEAAVRSIVFNPEQKRKVDASVDARRRDIEKWAVENLDKVRVALAARKEVESISSFDQLARAKDAINPVKQEGLLERLLRNGAISVALKVNIDRVVTEYVEARRDEWQKDTGADVMKIATLIGQQGFADQTGDVLAALDRLLERAAPTLAADARTLNLAPEQQRKLDQAVKDAAQASADPKAAVAPVRSFVMGSLTTEQARALLSERLAPAAK